MKRLLCSAVLLGAALGAGRAGAATINCSSTTTSLDAYVTCYKATFPDGGSNGFVAPSSTQQADWRTLVREMLNGTCTSTVPASLGGIVQRRTFSDAGTSYCMLEEVLDANGNGKLDRGWGVFVTNASPAPGREKLHHTAPHPLYDLTTENQAAGVFKGTGSRSFLLHGAHRGASSQGSCNGSGQSMADAAHDNRNMFHPTYEERAAYHGAASWWAIQWHGMASDSCSENVYISHGLNQAPQPTDKISVLKSKVLQYHSGWDVDTPGPTSGCSLNATTNVQGRHLNGVSAVCSTAASSYSGKFIHVEQDASYRNSADWLQPVIDTWPAGSPGQPVTLAPTADAYVRGGSHAANNFGTATALHAKLDVDTAGNQRRAFLKFDLSSVASVASAKLRLLASLSATTSPQPGLSVFAVSNTSWGETSITYSNMPAMGSLLGTAAVSSTSYAWKEIDVTSYLQAEKAAGRNVVTLGLNGSIDSYGYVQAHSREAAAANRPQLVVQP